jgi:mannosyltransferase PIG-V
MTDARVDQLRRWFASVPGFADGLALLIALHIALGLVALFQWWQGHTPGPCNFELAFNGWHTIPPLADQGPEFPLVGVWQRWDACWYSKIATFGYEPTELSVNFWPLLPVLMGVVARLLSVGPALAGLVVSGIAYVAAVVGLYRLVGRDVDEPTARRTTLLLTIFPSAFFLFAPFTEALFLALAVWTIAFARERRWLAAGIVGFLAALTRIQGVFLVLPVGWEALAAAGVLGWRPRSDLRPPAIQVRSLVVGMLAAAGSALGFASFLLYSKAVAGQTPLDTQDAWGGRQFHPPWDVANAAWRWAIERHDPLQFLNLALLFIFGALLVVAARRLPFAYTLYALPQFVLLITRIQPTPLTSTNRYVLVLFPAFVVLALIPWQSVRLAWAIGSLLFLAVLVQLFLSGGFVA